MVHTKRVSDSRISSLLLAGAVLTAAMLGGCNDSATKAEANRKAVEASNKAAARTAVAGDYRPTETLVEKSSSADTLKSLDKQIQASGANPDSLRQFIDKKPATADLKDAAAILNEALSSSNPTPPDDVYKSLVQAQIGQVQLQQAQEQLTLLQDDLVALSRRASSIMIVADRAAMLGGSATTIEGKLPIPPSIESGLAKANNDAKAAAAVARQKAGVVTALENQIKSLQQRSQELESKGSAAALKAEKESGMESVDAMKDALKLRGEGDTLNAQIASLQPKLQAAKTDADVAAVNQKSAEDTIAALQRAKDNILKQSQARADQSATLRDQALKLIQDKDGLASQAREFKQKLGELNSRLEVARSAAGTAKSKFSESLSSLRNYRQSIDAMKETLKPKDPLITARNRRLPESLLQTFQANAAYRAAQTETIGLLAVMLQNQVSDAVSRAYKLAGDTSENVLQSGGDADVNRAREAARKELDLALRSAEQAAVTETENTGPGKYLAFSTQAAIYQALFAVTGDAGAKANYEKAMQEAATRNPSAVAAAAQ